jgi:hypothetical protein
VLRDQAGGPLPAGRQAPVYWSDYLSASDRNFGPFRFISVCEGGDIPGLIHLLDTEVAGLATVMGLPPLAPVSGVEVVDERAMVFFGPAPVSPWNR